MKRIAFVLFLFLSTIFTANAQYFVGGSFGFNTTGGKVKYDGNSTDKASTTTFGFSPKVGYVLSENFCIGLQLNLSTRKVTTPGAPDDIVEKSFTFGLTPFARYYAVRLNKLALFAQGNIGFSTTKTKEKVGSTSNDGPTTNIFGFNVHPGISYDLNDRVSLEAVIGGFNFGFTSAVEKEDIAGETQKDITNTFGLGVDLNNIATTGFITIGAIVKF
ncbi:MAG TPA: outer membrane beta-barrel protein [Tenuifilaceae bacterium]|nr:outer membrane beta-barrel protein [Tenuifilaceae bacterium]HOZ13273.1 outer membrane beta-barrel protein [Tenuifilaceae bacterium]HPI45209.1 outer membrane beta-barrel protein [Tenuifilaceae bacterium]HPN20740.1 outer membrane beta-barrel protein [Tenuifilaceae bacterium]